MILPLARRLLQLVPILFGLTLLSFFLIHLVPGDPVQQMLGGIPNPRSVQIVRHELGLDRSLPAQYWDFLSGAVHGDLGRSIIVRDSVANVVGPRIAPTAFLIVYAAAIAILLTFPLALVSALRPNAPADHAIRVVSTLGFAMPAFWVGFLLVTAFSPVGLGWFPVSGYGSGFGGHLYALFLPALTLGLFLTPMLVRSLRASLIEVLQSEYVEAARARGLSELRVVGKHALRNASLATLTVLSVNVAWLVGGTVVVERVFDVPGLGPLMVDSVLKHDYPVVSGIALVFGVMVVAVSFLTDVAYAAIDPRTRRR